MGDMFEHDWTEGEEAPDCVVEPCEFCGKMD